MVNTVKTLQSERAGHCQAEGLQAASVSIVVTAASAAQQRCREVLLDVTAASTAQQRCREVLPCQKHFGLFKYLILN